MKTGKEVLDRALQLLGYTNHNGEIDSEQNAELIKRGSVAVNQIYYDIQTIEKPNNFDGAPISMTQDIPLSFRAVNDIMPYGVAMLIADDNTGLYSKFAAAYDGKRKTATRISTKIRDVLPTVFD